MALAADLQPVDIGQSLFEQMLAFSGGQDVHLRFEPTYLRSPVDFPVDGGFRGFRLHTIVSALECQARGQSASHFTVFTSGDSPEIRTSNLSPDLIGPIPLGVPVRMMSPGRSVRFVEIKLTSR